MSNSDSSEGGKPVVNFIVIGGSIAGLATAYALKEAGHEALVVEKSDGKGRSRGGIRSPPNMTHTLFAWGMEEKLKSISRVCPVYKFRNGCNGNYLGRMAMAESMQGFDGDHVLSDLYLTRHGDLHSLMFDAAKDAGVKFLWNKEVVSINKAEASVTLKDGQVLQGDVIIAADGHNSTARALVIDEPETYVADDEHSVHLSFEVATEVLRADPELAPLSNPAEWLVWFGDDYIVHAYMMPDEKSLTVAITHKYRKPNSDQEEEWLPRSFDEFDLDIDNNEKFERRLQKIIKHAEHIAGKIYRIYPQVNSMVCDNSRILLVGDAGHPLLPNSHHKTALGIEDAQTLGMLFSRIRDKDQIPQFLLAFEEIREPRIAFVTNFERNQRATTFVPRGPIMKERDEMMSTALSYDSMDLMDEAMFGLVWEDELKLVMFDAGEKVEDWWTKWGFSFEEPKESLPNGRRKSVVGVTVMREERRERSTANV